MIRKTLYMSAIVAKRYNPIIKEFAQRDFIAVSVYVNQRANRSRLVRAFPFWLTPCLASKLYGIKSEIK